MSWLTSIWAWLTTSKADDLEALRLRMAMLEVRVTNLEGRPKMQKQAGEWHESL